MPGAPIQLFDPTAAREGAAAVQREGNTLTMTREVNPATGD
jgi:host factor-I protein